ncbi:pilus assembly protein PapC, partial [Burkholderia cenocepacia]|nr:pilus assembly protein PapC [Burkholderia cenocepacia]
MITLRPSREEVILVVPQDAMLGPVAELGNFTQGGMAAIVNYDITALRSSFNGNSRDYLSATTQLGFNLNDWV